MRFNHKIIWSRRRHYMYMSLVRQFCIPELRHNRCFDLNGILPELYSALDVYMHALHRRHPFFSLAGHGIHCSYRLCFWVLPSPTRIFLRNCRWMRAGRSRACGPRAEDADRDLLCSLPVSPRYRRQMPLPYTHFRSSLLLSGSTGRLACFKLSHKGRF